MVEIPNDNEPLYICTSAGRPGCTKNCEHAIPHCPFDECDLECSVYGGANCAPCNEQGIKDTDAWAPTEAHKKLVCPGAGSSTFCDTCEHAVPHEHNWDCELECNLVGVDGGSECVPSTPESESTPVPSDDVAVLRPERGFSEEEIAMLVGTPTTSNDRKPALSADDIATTMETAATTIGGKRILTTDDIEGIVRETTLAARVDMLRYLKRTFVGLRDGVLADIDEVTENSNEFFGNDHLR